MIHCAVWSWATPHIWWRCGAYLWIWLGATWDSVSRQRPLWRVRLMVRVYRQREAPEGQEVTSQRWAFSVTPFDQQQTRYVRKRGTGSLPVCVSIFVLLVGCYLKRHLKRSSRSLQQRGHLTRTVLGWITETRQNANPVWLSSTNSCETISWVAHLWGRHSVLWPPAVTTKTQQLPSG